MKKENIYTKKENKKNLVYRYGFQLVIILSISALFSSCEEEYYGREGRTGEAYLSLTWANEMPQYLDAGTGAIPPAFRWGDYYKAYPGSYILYYEGSVWNGFGWTNYAYEVEYEIWNNEGEPGRPYGVDGMDGDDTYLNIECSPYGPFIFTTEKSKNLTNKYLVLENTDEEIKVVQNGVAFSIRITYKKSIHSSER